MAPWKVRVASRFGSYQMFVYITRYCCERIINMVTNIALWDTRTASAPSISLVLLKPHWCLLSPVFLTPYVLCFRMCKVNSKGPVSVTLKGRELKLPITLFFTIFYLSTYIMDHEGLFELFHHSFL